MERRFQQLDVFTGSLGLGNPVAVVVDGDGLDDASMARFARWTNLSETTFLLPPTAPDADYRVRIFTPTEELPFAGHPTLGSCQAWMNAGGEATEGVVIQECGAGNIAIEVDEVRLSFAAPPLRRSGPVDGEVYHQVVAALGTEPVSIAWADNGPPWVAAEFADAATVQALRPTIPPGACWYIGAFGAHAAQDTMSNEAPEGVAASGGSGPDIEVRAFFPGAGVTLEDPVTGSLNAGIAQILFSRSPEMSSYVAHQGAALGRAGVVHLRRDTDGAVWVGGSVVSAISGTVDL